MAFMIKQLSSIFGCGIILNLIVHSFIHFIISYGPNASSEVPFHYGATHVNVKRSSATASVRYQLRPKLALPTPIIVVGLPKAGTSSIFNFFDCHGLRSQHWFCCKSQQDAQYGGPELMARCMMKNLEQQTAILRGCGRFEVYAELNGPRKSMIDIDGRVGVMLDDGTYDFDGPGRRIFLPQHHYMQKVHDQYPNATFILNLRPVEDWVRSVLGWRDDLSTQLINEFVVQNNSTALPTNLEDTKRFLTSIFENHTDFIRHFVAAHPSHALIELDISKEVAGDVLAEKFGLNSENSTASSTCWQRKNEKQQTLATMEENIF